MTTSLSVSSSGSCSVFPSPGSSLIEGCDVPTLDWSGANRCVGGREGLAVTMETERDEERRDEPDTEVRRPLLWLWMELELYRPLRRNGALNLDGILMCDCGCAVVTGMKRSEVKVARVKGGSNDTDRAPKRTRACHNKRKACTKSSSV